MMKPSHILLFGANAFGIGLLTPVLSLVFLSHGATIETLSLYIGIFAAMVVVLELPSGILADLIGKKRIYLISAIFMIFSYLLLLLGSHYVTLMVACSFQGIGRAFSSGSIEALEIENYMECYGSKSLEKINSTMAVIESIGLALGSITGGLLGFLDNTYWLLLVTAATLQAFIILMTICFIKEGSCKGKNKSPLAELKGQLNEIGSSLKLCIPVTTIILMASALGMILCTVEIYWQPALQVFLPEHLGWIFGLITCMGFIGISIGSKLMERFIRKRKERLIDNAVWHLYWFLRFLLLLSVALLGFSHQVWLFMAVFILVYVLLGAGNLIENTIFHASVANGQRASMMSLLSLCTRAGGLGTSLLGSLVIANLSFSAVWLMMPLLAAGLICGIMIFFYRIRLKHLSA